MAASHLLLLLYSLLLGLLLASTMVANQCHDDDHAALGSPYHFASWTPDSAGCDWYDVDCDADTGRVIGLHVFQDANMSGTIPDAIANLTYLETLTLHHLPAISGAIPDSFATLSNLSQLTISYTGVSGPIPSFLGALTALTLLALSYNSLTGAIPPSNRLSGTIPPLLSKSPDSAYLWLCHNNLSGAIPAEFAAVNFSHVNLSRNALTGDATCLFGAGKPLEHLDVSRNALSFNLSDVEFPEQPTYADLSHNTIGGSVLAQVANLQLFNVSYNRMTGEVPARGSMARFDSYSFVHNKCLCGAPLTACRQRPINYLH